MRCERQTNFEKRLSTWDEAELLVESLVEDSELEDGVMPNAVMP